MDGSSNLILLYGVLSHIIIEVNSTLYSHTNTQLLASYIIIVTIFCNCHN